MWRSCLILRETVDLLVALTMGAGFGAPNARDPYGAETWDRGHPEAQFTVLRDPVTTDPVSNPPAS